MCLRGHPLQFFYLQMRHFIAGVTKCQLVVEARLNLGLATPSILAPLNQLILVTSCKLEQCP